MDKQQAMDIMIAYLNFAQTKGVFTLQDSSLILEAVTAVRNTEVRKEVETDKIVDVTAEPVLPVEDYEPQ